MQLRHHRSPDQSLDQLRRHAEWRIRFGPHRVVRTGHGLGGHRADQVYGRGHALHQPLWTGTQMSRRSEQGFTIIEIMLAVIVLSVGVMALVGSSALATRMVG